MILNIDSIILQRIGMQYNHFLSVVAGTGQPIFILLPTASHAFSLRLRHFLSQRTHHQHLGDQGSWGIGMEIAHIPPTRTMAELAIRACLWSRMHKATSALRYGHLWGGGY